jgi:hypothetical protein
MTEFDPFEMCRILNEEKVEYVVLGGFAADHRSPPATWMSFPTETPRILTGLVVLSIE